MSEVPSQARVVVIGGGIIGTSVAYHLAHLGWKDVVLLERDRLTSGTTWHAAGLMVTFGSTSETSTEMRKYTRDLYTRLEAETGQATGFKPVGFIEVAADRTASRSTAGSPRSTATAASTSHEISPAEVKRALPARPHRRHPRRLLRGGGRAREPGRRHDGARQGRPHAGRARSSRACRRPTSSLRRAAPSPACAPTQGDIEGEYVVNCAGMWARQLGETAGRDHPAPGRRALLPHHRADRRRLDATGRCSRTRPRTATTARRSAA